MVEETEKVILSDPAEVDHHEAPHQVGDDYLEELIRYYSDAGPDYQSWSQSFNMHFGYFRKGMNPFRLEPQLEAMNQEVFARLGWSGDRDGHLLDMGCGLGATTRSGARTFPAT